MRGLGHGLGFELGRRRRNNPAAGSVLDLDFEHNIYYGRTFVDLESRHVSSAFTEDRQGNWIEIPADTPRRTDKGVILEYDATNAVQNSWLFATVVGGSLPVGWASSVPIGATLDVIALGTFKGLPYIDLHLHGTATGGSFSIRYGGLSDAPAGVGENWVCSTFVHLLTRTGLTDLRVGLQALNAGFGGVAAVDSGNVIDDLAAWSRPYTSLLGTPAGTAKLLPQLTSGQQDFSGGVVLDEVIRIAVPQLEQWNPVFSADPFPTSPIRTQTEPASRSGEWLRVLQSGLVSDQGTYVIIAETPPARRFFAAFLEANNHFDAPNQFGLYTSADGLTLYTYIRNNDIESSAVAAVPYPGDGVRFCAAFCFAGTDVSLSINGGTRVDITSDVLVYDSMDWLNIGSTWGGVHQTHAPVQRVIAYNAARPAELETLSALATWAAR